MYLTQDDADRAVGEAELIEAALERRYPESFPDGGLNLNTMGIMAAVLLVKQQDVVIDAEFTHVVPLEIEGGVVENAAI